MRPASRVSGRPRQPPVKHIPGSQAPFGVCSVRGFTLLELLIALAILAIVSIAVFNQGGDTARQLGGLEQKTLARWVAENELARFRLQRRLQDEPLRPGTRRDEVSHGDRYWQVVRDITSTDHPSLYRLELAVFALVDGGEVGPVDTLIAFEGVH